MEIIVDDIGWGHCMGTRDPVVRVCIIDIRAGYSPIQLETILSTDSLLESLLLAKHSLLRLPQRSRFGPSLLGFQLAVIARVDVHLARVELPIITRFVVPLHIVVQGFDVHLVARHVLIVEFQNFAFGFTVRIPFFSD